MKRIVFQRPDPCESETERLGGVKYRGPWAAELRGASGMRAYFDQIVARVPGQTQGAETWSCLFQGEESAFIRFNEGHPRQHSGEIRGRLLLDLLRGDHVASIEIAVEGNLEADTLAVADAIRQMRGWLKPEPAAPLWTRRGTETTVRVDDNRLPDGAVVEEAVGSAAAGVELSGVYAAGAHHRGFASAHGQRDWSTRHSFSFDWFLRPSGGPSVKSSYGGFEWSSDEFADEVARGRTRLEIMAQPSRDRPSGTALVFLSPEAVADFLRLLRQGAFGTRHLHGGESPLVGVWDGSERLCSAVTLEDRIAGSIQMPFGPGGHPRAPSLTLVDRGGPGHCLVSPRSAASFQEACNGAQDDEIPGALRLVPGDRSDAELLSTVSNGLYVANLSHLAWDGPGGCFTGVTRFGTALIRDGAIDAPVPEGPIRGRLQDVLGSGLLGLSDRAKLLIDEPSYLGRSTTSVRAPAALVEGLILD